MGCHFFLQGIFLAQGRTAVSEGGQQRHSIFDPPEFFGNAVKMKASSFDKNDHAYDFGDRLALIEKNGFDFESYPETWLKYNSFVDSTGSSISYSSEDLIVTK